MTMICNWCKVLSQMMSIRIYIMHHFIHFQLWVGIDGQENNEHYKTSAVGSAYSVV